MCVKVVFGRLGVCVYVCVCEHNRPSVSVTGLPLQGLSWEIMHVMILISLRTVAVKPESDRWQISNDSPNSVHLDQSLIVQPVVQSQTRLPSTNTHLQ